MSNSWDSWEFYKKGEAKLIRQIKEAFPLEWENNIGNDGALFAVPPDKKTLITQDLLLEGVHFFSSMPMEALAYKSLMVSLSDIFADGGRPQSLLLGLQVPQNQMPTAQHFVETFISLAKQYNVSIIGGDTVRANQWGISVVCLGHVQKPWLRKNARLGDHIYVTGCLGGAARGLKFLQKGESFDFKNLYIRRHCYPPYLYPFVDYCLSHDIPIHAAVDISDGFLEDLTQILLESEKSCIINEDRIPKQEGVTLLDVLWGGEDYELIVCSPTLLPAEDISDKTGIKVSYIGEVMSPRERTGEIFSERTGEVLNISGKMEKFFHF